MIDRFVNGEVRVQLRRGIKLTIRGTIVHWDREGVILRHSENKLTFYPFENILWITLVKEAITE